MQMSRAELERLLRKHGINTDLFGQGEAKSLTHLLKELREGECELIFSEDGVERIVRGAYVVVRHGGERLYEDRQEFKDGRVRERQIDASIGEKMKPGEEPLFAARRALSEELGVHAEVELVAAGEDTKFATASQSYPGLSTRYLTHRFEVELPTEHYRPEGYAEHQPDKSTFWLWRREA